VQSSETTIQRFAAFAGEIDPAELLDDEGRIVTDFRQAVEARITKRGPGGVFTVRVDFTRLMEFSPVVETAS
jgi:hypothetical protein